MSGKEQLFEVSLEREGAYRSISAALEAAERCVPDVTVPVRVLVGRVSTANGSKFVVRM